VNVLPTFVPERGDALPFPNAAASGELLFTGGHIADLDPLAPDAETQARQAMDALERTLVAGGASLRSVVRIECFLAGRECFDAWNAVYKSAFGDRCPPRTTLLAGFVFEGLLIELQATAVVTARPEA
jgi:2-iminobutanoate/2-iminopropanoate deaminase